MSFFSLPAPDCVTFENGGRIWPWKRSKRLSSTKVHVPKGGGGRKERFFNQTVVSAVEASSPHTTTDRQCVVIIDRDSEQCDATKRTLHRATYRIIFSRPRRKIPKWITISRKPADLLSAYTTVSSYFLHHRVSLLINWSPSDSAKTPFFLSVSLFLITSTFLLLPSPSICSCLPGYPFLSPILCLSPTTIGRKYTPAPIRFTDV